MHITRFLAIVLLSLAPYATRAATCAAGQYLDGTTCTPCPAGYYCNGNDTRQLCTNYGNNYYQDTPGSTTCKKCPEIEDAYKSGFFMYNYWENGGSSVHTRIESCRVQWYRATQAHEIYSAQTMFGCYYHPDVGYGGNDFSNPSKCTIVSITCDAGYAFDVDNNPNLSMVDTTVNEVWTHGYEFMQPSVCTPVGIGKYSPTGSSAAFNCPPGTTTRTDTAKSADECVPLCGDEFSTLKTSTDISVNIYANKYSTPALNISTPYGICYVTLAPNSAPGAINIQHGQNTYHTTN